MSKRWDQMTWIGWLPDHLFFFSFLSKEFPLLQFVTSASCLFTAHLWGASCPAFPMTSFRQWRISGPLTTFSPTGWTNCYSFHAMFSITSIIPVAFWVCFSCPITLLYWGNHYGCSFQFFKYLKHISSALQYSIVISWPVIFRTLFPSLQECKGRKKLKSFEKTQICGCFFPKDKF